MQRAEELIATFKLPCKKIKRYIYIYILVNWITSLTKKI